MNDIFIVILEFCGGKRTNLLYEKLSAWNPSATIHILDNASPQNKCKYITHQNSKNSGIGGGIKDCIRLACENDCRYLFLITNDIIPVTKLDMNHLSDIISYNKGIVQLSVSLTQDSDKKYYPWMLNQGQGNNRVVTHADILCCVLDTEFIKQFGGFPDSWSGWGYDWELSYQAGVQNKKIVICDRYKVEHIQKTILSKEKVKMNELKSVYNKKYGDYRVIYPFTI